MRREDEEGSLKRDCGEGGPGRGGLEEGEGGGVRFWWDGSEGGGLGWIREGE